MLLARPMACAVVAVAGRAGQLGAAACVRGGPAEPASGQQARWRRGAACWPVNWPSLPVSHPVPVPHPPLLLPLLPPSSVLLQMQRELFLSGLRSGFVRSMALRRGCAGEALMQALWATIAQAGPPLGLPLSLLLLLVVVVVVAVLRDAWGGGQPSGRPAACLLAWA